MTNEYADLEKNRKNSDKSAAEYLSCLSDIIKLGDPIPDEFAENLADTFSRAAKNLAKGKGSHVKSFLCERLGIYDRGGRQTKKNSKKKKLDDLFLAYHKAFDNLVPILPKFDKDCAYETWQKESKANIVNSLAKHTGYSHKHIRRILERIETQCKSTIESFKTTKERLNSLNDKVKKLDLHFKFRGSDINDAFPKGLPVNPTLKDAKRLIDRTKANRQMKSIPYDFDTHKPKDIVLAIFECFGDTIPSEYIQTVIKHLKSQ